jgi:hypothetical protein
VSTASPPQRPEILTKSVAELLFGPNGGMQGYLGLAGIRSSGVASHDDCSLAILESLAVDNSDGHHQLKNSTLVLQCFTENESPSDLCIASAGVYKNMPPATPVHAKVQEGMALWPRSAEQQRAWEARIAEFVAMDRARRVSEIERLLQTGTYADYQLVVQLMTPIAKADSLAIGDLASVFLLKSMESPFVTVGSLLGIAALTLDGDEGDATAATNIGAAARMILQDGASLERDKQASLRTAAIAALEGVDMPAGSAVGCAVAVGGCGESPGAGEALVRLVKRSKSALVESTALVNLGYCLDPQRFTEYLPRGMPTSDPMEVTRTSDYLCGLMTSLRRHPEQSYVAAPYLETALRVWSNSRDEDLLRRDVLEQLQYVRVPELSSLLSELSKDANKSIAKAASTALASWKQR